MKEKCDKPIIGLVGRVDTASDDDKVSCIWEACRKSIVRKGGIPILLLPNQTVDYLSMTPDKIPNLVEEEKEDLKRLVDLCDGIFLPGGYQWYEYDEYIYQYALSKDMPILGVCLGMQMIGKMDVCKEKIACDITEKNDTILNHHQRNKKYVHSIEIQPDTLLANIVKRSNILVNSRHRYHLPKVKNLIVSAYSEDGLIEAIESSKHAFVLGVQWHPETMLSYDIPSNQILSKFIEEASIYAQKKKNLF